MLFPSRPCTSINQYVMFPPDGPLCLSSSTLVLKVSTCGACRQFLTQLFLASQLGLHNYKVGYFYMNYYATSCPNGPKE